MLKKISRYWHTLRHLRWQQWFYRLWYRLPRRVPQQLGEPVANPGFSVWQGMAWRQPEFSSATQCEFLNQQGSIKTVSDWNHPAQAKLWLYKLHYFDDLDALNAIQRQPWHHDLINRWIVENPPGYGNGWEPYPISLRVVNWIKFFSWQENIPQHWLDNLALQITWLAQRPEYHILGNHLWANAKALLFAGCFFKHAQAAKWRTQACDILHAQLTEQFLHDGAHFELSPMYHSIMLWDMLEIFELLQQNDTSEHVALKDLLLKKIQRGIPWFKTMCHPDGDIAFFNDAWLNNAPKLADVLQYCQQLQIDAPLQPTKQHDSGYFRLTNQHAVLLVDAANIGPDYLPGHAHADQLSFELSVFGQRCLVNSGTSVYAIGALRDWQRSTAAHNTIEIDGKNAAEVWGGFRVAKRGYTHVIKHHMDQHGGLIDAYHDGYKKISHGPRHQRKWHLDTHTLTIIDQLVGKYQQAVARFYLHPDIQAVQKDEYIELVLPDKKSMLVKITGGLVELNASCWYPDFSRSVTNQCLTIRLTAQTLTTQFIWS